MSRIYAGVCVASCRVCLEGETSREVAGECELTAKSRDKIEAEMRKARRKVDVEKF